MDIASEAIGENEQLLDTFEAAAFIGKSRVRIYQMIREQKLDVVKQRGYPLRIKKSSLVPYKTPTIECEDD